MLGSITTNRDSGRGRTLVQRAVEVGREDGPDVLVEKIPPYVYQQLWPHLPATGHVVLNDVESTIEKKALDDHVPRYLTRFVQRDDPAHEAQYVGCLRSYVQPGEDVVVVGGGEGVSTVATAECVGSTGSVSVYEGGAEQVGKTRRATELNDVDDRVSVHHAIVSTDYSLRSSGVDASIVEPAALPECDTLAIDADGAELPILEDFDGGPDRLVVEHHVVLDDGDVVLEYQPETVRDHIHDLGYEIVEERAHPERAYGHAEERIFVAERTD